MNQLRKATVISTGKKIEVYKHRNGTWIDYANCETEYKKSEVQILQ